MRTGGRGQSSLLLLDVVDVLNRMKIPHAVIGAYAVSFHGIVRASLDADVLIPSRNTDSEKDSLLCALSAEGLDVQYHRGDIEDPIHHVIRVKDPFANQVDILSGIRKMDEKVFDRTIPTVFGNSTLSIVSAEDLIAMKVFAGSPKDIYDVAGLLSILGGHLNRDLLTRIAGQYGKVTQKRLSSLLKNNR
jgi:hypothetical protein